MIYITYSYCEFSETNNINKIFKVKSVDVMQEYRDFMLKKAKKLNISINPHWLNSMNYENHNKHLSEDEYKIKVKKWGRFLKKWNINDFILKKLGGKELSFYEINCFK